MLKMMRTAVMASVLGTMVLAGLACSSGDTGTAPDTPAATAPEATGKVLYDTIVAVRADGTFESKTVATTLEERQRHMAAREAALANPTTFQGKVGRTVEQIITEDTTCSDGYGWWGFDDVNQTGNSLCLHLADPSYDTIALSNFCHQRAGAPFYNCLNSWSQWVVSYWAGAKDGQLFNNSGAHSESWTGVANGNGPKANCTYSDYTYIKLYCHGAYPGSPDCNGLFVKPSGHEAPRAHSLFVPMEALLQT